MMRWKVPLVALLAAVMSLLGAGTASAADWLIHARAVHGHDWGEMRSEIPNYAYPDYIIVCDGEADGHYVWAQYLLFSVSDPSFSEYRKVYDGDGANNNSCGIDDYRDSPYYAYAIRVCEYDGGCTAWEYNTGQSQRASQAGVAKGGSQEAPGVRGP